MGFAVERRTASTTSGPISDVRYKTAIHDVDMDPICAGGIDGANLFAQAREVGGQYGRRDQDRRRRYRCQGLFGFGRADAVGRS